MIPKTKISSKIITSKNDIIDISKERILTKHNGGNVVIPHVCNNIGLFGAGFASYVASNFPDVKANFEMLGTKNKLGHVQYVKVLSNKSYKREMFFANMIAQNKVISPKNPRPLNYEALVKCMSDVRSFCLELSKHTENQTEIHCPKFGSGLAGGNWDLISELIKDIWSNIPVFVYIK